MLKKLIPANKDQEVLIRENEKYLWHVKQTTRDAVPGNDPTKVRSTTWVATYDDKAYDLVFVRGHMSAAGIKEARVVHDPHLQRRLDSEKKINRPTGDAKATTPKKDEVKDTDDDLGTAKIPTNPKPRSTVKK